MACAECAARLQLARESLLNAKIKEALGHAVKGVAEAVGLKPKTGLKELHQSTPKKGKE